MGCMFLSVGVLHSVDIRFHIYITVFLYFLQIPWAACPPMISGLLVLMLNQTLIHMPENLHTMGCPLTLNVSMLR